MGITTAVDGVNFFAGNYNRNRIINGDMSIDQRNAGAAVAAVAADVRFAVDRFQVRADTSTGTTIQQSTVAPAGFTKSFLITVGTGAAPAANAVNYFAQRVEGTNIADLDFGKATASPVTLSFWVRSSLTGTFGVALKNADGSRCFLASYTISAANTLEKKTITIPGDTAGTWLTTNGIGINIQWDLGRGTDTQGTATGAWQTSDVSGLSGGVKLVATSGATMYFTGVQLEAGSAATPFEYRRHSVELISCQRYFEILGAGSSSILFGGYGGSEINTFFKFAVQKRAAATVTQVGTWSKTNVAAEGASATGIDGFSYYLQPTAAARTYEYNNATGARFEANSEL